MTRHVCFAIAYWYEADTCLIPAHCCTACFPLQLKMVQCIAVHKAFKLFLAHLYNFKSSPAHSCYTSKYVSPAVLSVKTLCKSYSCRTLDLLLPKRNNAGLNKVLLFVFFFPHLTSPSNAYIIYPCPKVLYMHVHYAGANEWLTSTHSKAHLFAMLEEASRSHNTTAHASVGSTKNFLPLWNMSSNKSFV